MQVNSSEAIRHAWDARVDTYEAMLADRQGRAIASRIELEAFKHALAPNVSLHILDAGCGVGFHGRALLSAGHRVTFVDVSARMLARAQKLAGKTTEATFRQLDIRDLDGIGDASFDAVVSGGTVISDCGNPARALAELARAVRAGGTIGFSVRNIDGPQQRGEHGSVIPQGGPGFDWWFFSVGSASELCERCGLSCRRAYPVHMELLPDMDTGSIVRHHLESQDADEWRTRAWEIFVVAEKR